jgi:hypothetical protein
MLDVTEVPPFLHHSLHSRATAKSERSERGGAQKSRFSLRCRATAEFSPAFSRAAIYLTQQLNTQRWSDKIRTGSDSDQPKS